MVTLIVAKTITFMRATEAFPKWILSMHKLVVGRKTSMIKKI